VPELIDLVHLGRPRVIAAWLLARGDEPALVDCGPGSCLPALRDGLAAHGLGVGDLRHLLLTHIHLDHAGAAGALVRENPALTVHVSEIGAPHLVDPSRLERSARRLYGDEFDRLWGELVPVPDHAVRVIGDAVLDLEAFPTPGHASHHISLVTPEGDCYSGDASGVRIVPTRYIAPVSPPPDIDVEAWHRSLDEIAARRPARLLLPHFGAVEDPSEHLARAHERLDEWAEQVGNGISLEEFESSEDALLYAEADPATAQAFRQAGPLWQSHAGLERYWAKKREAAA
jgi:glyoxylase-like metal-dependent hydrolase (beta-lactamase superfamily II)